MAPIGFMLLAIMVVCANARHIQWEETPYDVYEELGYPVYDLDEEQSSGLENTRVRRQTQGTLTLNGDGSTGLGAKIPLAGNDKNVLSALGSVNMDNKMNTASHGFGLALDNVNGHGVSVMKETLPGFGSKLTGAGHATLFQNDNHKFGANAFVSRNMPSIPNVPNFNTVGGGVDYMYKNKIGGSLGMASTPFLERKDYSAMGNLNLFHNPTTSVDFNAGFKKFDTPFMRSGWEPTFGLTFGKSFLR